jgi:hypothetical protein
MTTWTRFLRNSWLLGFLIPAQGQSHPEIVTADDLKAAIHDLLSHNDLFDAGHLSDRLGIGLRISPQKALNPNTISYEGTATANPPALYGSIHYEADVDPIRQVSSVRLSFGARICTPLRQWGAEWHVQTSGEWATDGGPYSELLVWPSNDGIHLSQTYYGDGCNFELWQTVKRLASIPVSPPGPLAPSSGLAEQIGELLLSDLRDYARIGRILNTEFVVDADSQRKGLLYRGAPSPDRVIPGFKSDFLYYGADSGWYMPPGFIAQPLHITDRNVELMLTADKDLICLSAERLTSGLQQRDHRIHRQLSESRDKSFYSVRGANLVSVSVTFEGDCATELRFHQVTDVAHSLGDPIKFTVKDSLNRGKDRLTDVAQRRINILAQRLRSVALGGMEIEEMHGKHSTATENQDLALVKQLISTALKRHGIALPQAGSEYIGSCNLRLQPDEPTVCVDVWL